VSECLNAVRVRPDGAKTECRDWSDPNWTSLKSLRGGVNDNAREDRRIMFGDNVIEIEGRSTFQLLVDEVGPLILCITCKSNQHCIFRFYILSTSSRSHPSFSGHWTITTFML